MRIGIDIDGVLTDIERFMIDSGTKFAFENNLPINIDINEYDDTKMFNCTDEQAIEFWRNYVIDYFENYPVRTYAKEVIQKLKEEGNEIYIITARNGYGVPPEFLTQVKEITEGWLKKNGIIYDKIIYSEGSKLPYCVGNYIEVMVEDSPKNITDISSKIPVICFHNDWNTKIEGNSIMRAYSWYDIYQKIKNMIKK